jgi:two-component system, sensor histidine kinase and response regulator
LAGWYLRNETLIQVSPSFVPMQYNTALGFFLAGLGVLLGVLAYRRGALGFGILVLLVGGLTLVQYIFGAELGIDQLFMEHYITTATSHPGRMAPNTALCFSLTGTAIVLGGWPASGRHRPSLISGLGALTFGLGFISFAGYVMELETAYGWGRLTRMAVHTAAGFMLLGGALIALAWIREELRKVELPRWLPLIVGIGVLTIAVSLWQALNADTAIGGSQYLVLGFGISLSIALSAMVSLLNTSR